MTGINPSSVTFLETLAACGPGYQLSGGDCGAILQAACDLKHEQDWRNRDEELAGLRRSVGALIDAMQPQCDGIIDSKKFNDALWQARYYTGRCGDAALQSQPEGEQT